MPEDSTQRRSWPPEVKALLERHPRDTWAGAGSPAALFWLDVHESFRRQCAALRAATDAYRSGATGAHAYAVLVAPQMRALLAHVAGHHQIEDFHYFPLFRSADPRIVSGFDILEQDHHELEAVIGTTLAALDSLVAAVHSGAEHSSAQRAAAERYIDSSERLCGQLLRHLEDEEELIIPLLIERASEA